MINNTKKTKTLGKMLNISPYKLSIANGFIPPGIKQEKLQKIKDQVAKRRLEQLAVKTYQPFTSKASRRKPTQVGA
jgi:hypothetical protein